VQKPALLSLPGALKAPQTICYNQKSGQVLAQALLVLFVAYVYWYVLHKESRERAWNISPLVHCGSTHFVFASCRQSCLVDCHSTGYCSVQTQQWTTASPV